MGRPSRRSKEEQLFLDPHRGAVNTIPDAPMVHSLIAPARIAENEVKMKHWEYLTSDLASRQLLSKTYMQTLVILVDNLALLDQYRDLLEDSGPLIPKYDKRTGTEIVEYVANPIFQLKNSVERSVTGLLAKLGMNPRDGIYLTNPDLKTVIDVPESSDTKKITYFT